MVAKLLAMKAKADKGDAADGGGDEAEAAAKLEAVNADKADLAKQGSDSDCESRSHGKR